MKERYYVIDGSLEFTRKEFEKFLLETVEENGLTPNEIPSLGTGVTPARSIEHHPFRVARQIFGADNVVTYEK